MASVVGTNSPLRWISIDHGIFLGILFGTMLVLIELGSGYGLAQNLSPSEETGNTGKNAPDRPLTPAAEIIRESNPTTPVELIQAIDHLVALGEMGLAQNYAQELGQRDTPQGNVDLTTIGDQLGPVPLLRIANNTQLDASARSFCTKILVAVKDRNSDPGRLTKLAKNAVSTDGQVRRTAIAQLRTAGPEAAIPLVSMLATGSPTEKAPARNALLQLGRQVVPPLLAVVATENLELRDNILFILRKLGNAAAADDLLVATIRRDKNGNPQTNKSPEDLANWKRISSRLRRSIHHYLLGHNLVPSAPDGNDVLWEWNDAKSTLTHREGSPALLSAQAAYRVARGLSQATSIHEHVVLEGIALLQWEKWNAGLEHPVDEQLIAALRELAGRDNQEEVDVLNFVEAIFEASLERGYIPAAIAAAEILANENMKQPDGVSLLARRGKSPHPLIKAVRHPDRRLRMAACRAILGLTPTGPFVGASIVNDTLGYFAASEGKPRVLIADGRSTRRQKLTSFLEKENFISDAYPTGRAAAQAAQRNPDYVAAFLSVTLGPRPIQDILHEFRTDSKTARLPIALLADPSNVIQADQLAGDDPLTLVLFPPQDSEMAHRDMQKLIALAGRYFVTEKERLEQAGEALQLFGKLASLAPGNYDPNNWEQILTNCLQIVELVPDAAAVLSQLKTPKAQVTLVEAANNASLPISARQSIANAFTQSIAKHGIALSTTQIQQQKERYDATKGANPQEEALLWSILEAIQHAPRSDDDH